MLIDKGAVSKPLRGLAAAQISGNRAMATPAFQLRQRTTRILCSTHCNLIRFQLDNVKIESLMYNYVANLIEQNKIRIGMSSGRTYNHISDYITFDSVDVGPEVIVHEATHALIDAVYPGLTITKGTGEACAYLAETMYSWATIRASRDLEIPHLTTPVSRLAQNALAHNRSHKQAYVCPPAEIDSIKAVMSEWMEIGRKDTMDGNACSKIG